MEKLATALSMPARRDALPPGYRNRALRGGAGPGFATCTSSRTDCCRNALQATRSSWHGQGRTRTCSGRFGPGPINEGRSDDDCRSLHMTSKI